MKSQSNQVQSKPGPVKTRSGSNLVGTESFFGGMGNMLIQSRFWRGISAGVIASVVVCSLAGSVCHAGGGMPNDAPGGRQTEYKGRFWPPFPRPVGKEAKWIHQYHYAHYWPYPQNCEDRVSVTNALNLQAANGWADATTLYHYHFDPETSQLNSSGMAHLEYILFRTPVHRRTVFVQMSPSVQIDQTRLASVQNVAGVLSQNAGIPEIALRRARAYGTSAEEIDVMSRRYIGSAPAPRLPVGGATSGGAAGSSGSKSSNE